MGLSVLNVRCFARFEGKPQKKRTLLGGPLKNTHDKNNWYWAVDVTFVGEPGLHFDENRLFRGVGGRRAWCFPKTFQGTWDHF